MKNLAFLLITLMSIGLVGCHDKFTSRQTNPGSIVIDGNNQEWDNQSASLGNGVTLGVKNDNQYLYLCFTAPIKNLPTQILEQEISFWFEPKDGQKVRLTLQDGRPNSPEQNQDKNQIENEKEKDKPRPERPGRPQAKDGDETSHDKIPDNKTNFELLERKMQIFAQTIQVTNSRGNSKTYQLERTFGTEAKIGVNQKKVVFEMKIPYNNDVSFPFRLNNAKKEEIFVKVETTAKEQKRKFDQEQKFSPDGSSQQQTNKPPRGGGKGGGRAPGGSMGKGNKGDKSSQQSTLSHQFSIVLEQN